MLPQLVYDAMCYSSSEPIILTKKSLIPIIFLVF